MTSPNPLAGDPQAPLRHGGNLDAARALFPDAPQPFVDLSTAINPHPYPITGLDTQDFARLPEPARLARLMERAAAYYGAPSADNVAAAPGSQILMALIADAVPKGRAAILGPTYAEHARVAALAGHDVTTHADLTPLGRADLVIAVNPNNPDGRVLSQAALRDIAEWQKADGGWLVVDEAFMDVGPREESLAGLVENANVVVLRSAGKFFGLAGLRLSFAIASRSLAAQLRAKLGPWPISGPALAVGEEALGDEAWSSQTRTSLDAASARLETLLQEASLQPVGRTALFSLVSSDEAQDIFMRLGKAGVLVRRFDENLSLLRFGLPGSEEEWQRLENALRASS